MEDGLNLSTFLNIHVGKKMDKQLKWAMRFYDSSSNRGGEESIHFYLMKERRNLIGRVENPELYCNE